MKSIGQFLLLLLACLAFTMPAAAMDGGTGEDCKDEPDCNTPILIDLENDGIHLTGFDDPVWFDIDADGLPNRMAWTDRGEGFLALDRNGNGSIDHGGELFGDVTVLTDGTRASNGYQALAELDSSSFRGNGDSFLDSSDAAFGTLLVWTDANHDGVSQGDELETLKQAGIHRIGLGYREAQRADRHGNRFQFFGRAWASGPNGEVRPILTWDVAFLVER